MVEPLKVNTILQGDVLPKPKRYLNNLLFNIPVGKTMKMIIQFYFDGPKTILDCTAGEQKIWEGFEEINQVGLDGQIAWDVTFSDIAKEARAQFQIDARKLDDKFKKPFDILVFDPPFIQQENSMYRFAVKPSNPRDLNAKVAKQHKHDPRAYYFRNFTDLNRLFIDTVHAFNKVSSNALIVKIGDRHENLALIPQHVYAILAYDKRFNPKSGFTLFDIIHYRPFRRMHGARIPFAQQVVSYYLIFKKELRKR